MKELTCEMCGSTNVVKQDGLFVCQACGTKYSVEEAKKIMEGTVEVTGTVKVDSSSDLENLYEIARRARDSENHENALKYYDQILMKESNSWEAQFYVVYSRAMLCKIAEIGISAQSVYNSFDSILELVKKTITQDQKQIGVINEIVDRSAFLSSSLAAAAINQFDGMNYQGVFFDEYSFYATESIAITYVLGDKLLEIFGDKYKNHSADLYKLAIDNFNSYIYVFGDSEGIYKNSIEILTQKIRGIDNSYNPPEIKKRDNGCYVATSIYGSYNCPEVWTLRRFRDDTLENSFYGRLFIKIYYAVSPTVVKYFGDTKVFKNFFKPRLDKLVNKLQEEGVESTYYIGK